MIRHRGIWGALLVVVVGTTMSATAVAQPGSAGGAIGNDDKSVSGTRPATPERRSPVPPAKKKATSEPRPSTASRPHGYQPMGSGVISDGNCTCKTHCDQFARAGQLAGPKLAQCKSDCEQRYAGCNKGATR
jgi:hypothetical protein